MLINSSRILPLNTSSIFVLNLGNKELCNDMMLAMYTYLRQEVNELPRGKVLAKGTHEAPCQAREGGRGREGVDWYVFAETASNRCR